MCVRAEMREGRGKLRVSVEGEGKKKEKEKEKCVVLMTSDVCFHAKKRKNCSKKEKAKRGRACAQCSSTCVFISNGVVNFCYIEDAATHVPSPFRAKSGESARGVRALGQLENAANYHHRDTASFSSFAPSLALVRSSQVGTAVCQVCFGPTG